LPGTPATRHNCPVKSNNKKARANK
jgi:hypothetical protein